MTALAWAEEAASLAARVVGRVTTPEEPATWERTILTVFRRAGGFADLQTLYADLPDFLQLGDRHLAETRHGGRPAYQHALRSYVSKMHRAGDLRRLARGRYELTRQGEARLRHPTNRVSSR